MNGWCPFADRIESPNFATGHTGRLAVVLHIMDGGFNGSIDWMRKVGTSAHFCISKTGRIVQTVSINDTAFGNGLAFKGGQWNTLRDGIYTRVKPTWKRITPPINPNFQTISIEHEGKPADVPADAMVAARTKVLRWIADEVGFVYVPGDTLIGHFNLDTVGRTRCPGPNFDFAKIAADANSGGITVVDKYAEAWGDTKQFPFRKEFGIPQRYMREFDHSNDLGAATSNETTIGGWQVQAFQRGLIGWKDGETVVAKL